MRVYRDYSQAADEIKRDLAELGKTVYAGYQSKRPTDLEEDVEALTTKELTNYDYRVIRPRLGDVTAMVPNFAWLEQEWNDREAGIDGNPSNPGHAWKLREEIWRPLLEYHGGNGLRAPLPRFSYTYSERFAMANQVNAALDALGENPHTRQAYISVWNPQIDSSRLGIRRVPCSIGYQITIRDGKVNIHYTMRSCDFKTHWANDVALAHKLLEWFLEKLNEYQSLRSQDLYELGSFTHSVGSLHVYAKDVASVF